MKVKIVSNKILIFCFIVIVLLFSVGLCVAYLRSLVAGFILLPISIIVFVSLFFVTNRFCSIITINFNQKVLTRHGLFFGYKSEMRFSEIRSIEVVDVIKEGQQYAISSLIYNGVDRAFKNSSFLIPFCRSYESTIKKICEESPNIIVKP